MKVLIPFLLFVTLFSEPVFSQVTNARMKELEEKRKATLQEIDATRKMLSTAKKNAMSSLHNLNVLRVEIKKRREVISILNKEIVEVNRQYREVSDNIYRLELELSAKKKKYAKGMRGLYKRGSQFDILMFIFSADNLNQSYRRFRYIKEFTDWQKKEGEEIIQKQEELTKNKEDLNKIIQSKSSLLKTKNNENQELGRKEEQQKVEVKELKSKEQQLQTELNKKRQQADNLNRRIQQLIEEEARRAAEEARRAAEMEAARQRSLDATRNKDNKSTQSKNEDKTSTASASKSTQKVYVTKESQELSDGFENNKGRLPFPLSGNYIIIGHFGQQQHQELKYVQVNNSGIDLQTQPGTTARAVYKGVVTRVFVMPGYNSSVIIRHGSYLTIYSNLSEVYVQPGASVSTKQAIGKIYSDPEDGNRTVLHFQLWKGTNKLNPEPWLGR